MLIVKALPTSSHRAFPEYSKHFLATVRYTLWPDITKASEIYPGNLKAGGEQCSPCDRGFTSSHWSPHGRLVIAKE